MPFKLIELKFHQDERGSLIPLELNRNLPFNLRGAFFVVNFPKGATRGKHAHTKIVEEIIVLCGVVKIKLIDYTGEHHILLDNPYKALIVYPITWIELESISENTIFLVCMNDIYDEKEVIRDFEYFKKVYEE